jgi:hypothetical protein
MGLAMGFISKRRQRLVLPERARLAAVVTALLQA